MGKRTLFNDGWLFAESKINDSIESVLWRNVTLPHDWLITDVKNLYRDSVGWYRHALFYDERKNARRMALYFEGVYRDCTLYVNGKEAGVWKYGYSSFEFEITDFLIKGENEILLKVVHQAPNSRWYTGAGIYRNVWLTEYAEENFTTNGIYVTTRPETEGRYEVRVEAEITVTHSDSRRQEVIFDILDDGWNQVGQSVCEVVNQKAVSSIIVWSPRLWSPEETNLYTLRARLFVEDMLQDIEYVKFGFRTTEFRPESGFYLNGIHMKLRGVCEHHDLGCLGAAVSRAAIRRKLKILKDMGVNAIRTAHNMPAVELLELADEMGFLVVDEAFDVWERAKTTYDYSRDFAKWWERDVESWVRRDRNHPCVILWSVGNEIYDTHADEKGQELTRKLQEKVLSCDPRGNGGITIGSNYMAWENARKCADILKIAGYNYGEKYYEEHHRAHPDWVLYGSETASVVQSRGIYHFPYAKSLLSDDDEQCSSLGNSSTSWGAKSMEACVIAERDCKFSMGQFLWTGFDYIGEPTPYHTKNSYFGQIDTAGFPKDSYYQYQAEWTSPKACPMIHIFPYWDFNEGQEVDVRVCSNASEVELFLNGVSQGRQRIDHERGMRLSADYRIPYKKGVLLGIAYDEQGQELVRAQRASFGEAKSLVAFCDKRAMEYCSSDMIFVTVCAEDINGNPVENANNRVFAEVTGPAYLAGMDNGDSTDTDEYQTNHRRMFSGKLLAVIASDNSKSFEDIHVKLTSKGLQPAEIYIPIHKACRQNGMLIPEIVPPVYEKTENDEIPIRKIELYTKGDRRLSPQKEEIEIFARTLPENADRHPLTWRVTDETGVDSMTAELLAVSEDGRSASIRAKGNGSFFVRCMTGNGSEHMRLISTLPLVAEGMQDLRMNPYESIPASLYGDKSGEVTNGNERGIATARDGKTALLYENLDFGDFGSDEIHINIFELEGTPTTIGFWKGLPGKEGSRKICEGIYHKESIWNVYQPETFHLKERYASNDTLGIELNKKVHIKDFYFSKKEKAFERLYAAENQSIYGDSFEIRPRPGQFPVVCDIGNNVTLVFREMDFGEQGAKSLTICGSTGLEQNTIHVRFQNQAGEEDNQIVEFRRSLELTEMRFELSPVYGKQTVMFVFLPGSRFDFDWLQFGNN